MTSPKCSYKAINNTPIKISDTLNSTLTLEALPHFSASILLHILEENFSSTDFIIVVILLKIII